MHDRMLEALNVETLLRFQASPAIAPQICGGGGEVYLDRLGRRCGMDAREFFLSTFQETLCGDPRDLVTFQGTPITKTSMRHLYHAAVLHRFCRAYYGEKITIIEIGGGFGNLARLCLQYGIAKRYAIVDFPVVHIIQFFFASEFFEEKCISFRVGHHTLPDGRSCRLELVQPGDVEAFVETVAGPLLFVSTMALTEIPRAGQDHYLDAIPANAYYLYGQKVTNALPGAMPADAVGELTNEALFSRLSMLCHPVDWEFGDYYGEFLGVRT